MSLFASLATVLRIGREMAWHQVAPSDDGAVQVAQKTFLEVHRTSLADRMLRHFDEIGFGCHSVCNEDGILLYLLAAIGFGARCAIELGAGVGYRSNTGNLALHHGFRTLMIDRSRLKVAAARHYFGRHRVAHKSPPVCVAAQVTRTNVDALIREHGFAGPVDVLAIDLDGIDWWIWKAVAAVEPRVVLVAMQDILGPDASLTVPYADDFHARWFEGTPDYGGASPAAFVKLAREKGYRLIGANEFRYKGVFLRNDVAPDLFPEVTPATLLAGSRSHGDRGARLARVRHLPWVEV